jgi:thymidylate synthase (FAD)
VDLFTFAVEGVSRSLLAQLTRHRIASYSQQSQRYVDGTKFEFVTPPEIEKNPKAFEAYKKVIDMQSDAYKEIRDALIVGYIKENSNAIDPRKIIGSGFDAIKEVVSSKININNE